MKVRLSTRFFNLKKEMTDEAQRKIDEIAHVANGMERQRRVEGLANFFDIPKTRRELLMGFVDDRKFFMVNVVSVSIEF